MLKINKKKLVAIAIVSFFVLLVLAMFYKKQHAVNEKSVSIPKITTDQPPSFYPIYALDELIRFDKEFDSLFQHNVMLFDNLISKINHGTLSTTLNEKEDTKQFLLSMNISGINPKDINISLQNRTLCIIARKNSQSNFYYRFLLPDTADSKKITAKAKYGVLEIIIPKAAQIPSKNVVIQEE